MILHWLLKLFRYFPLFFMLHRSRLLQAGQRLDFVTRPEIRGRSDILSKMTLLNNRPTPCRGKNIQCALPVSLLEPSRYLASARWTNRPPRLSVKLILNPQAVIALNLTPVSRCCKSTFPGTIASSLSRNLESIRSPLCFSYFMSFDQCKNMSPEVGN
jgi:hypothetical protein